MAQSHCRRPRNRIGSRVTGLETRYQTFSTRLLCATPSQWTAGIRSKDWFSNLPLSCGVFGHFSFGRNFCYLSARRNSRPRAKSTSVGCFAFSDARKSCGKYQEECRLHSSGIFRLVPSHRLFQHRFGSTRLCAFQCSPARKSRFTRSFLSAPDGCFTCDPFRSRLRDVQSYQ